jgi:tetratricopeptide (TPR) repeat protein
LKKLVNKYEGHPKALEIVAAIILDDEFQGNVKAFLENRDWLLVNTLDELIDQVIERLSDEELQCISYISVYDNTEKTLSLEGIAAQMLELNKRDTRENIIEALKRRQLLDFNKENLSYYMHPLVQEKAFYLLDQQDFYNANQRAYTYFIHAAKPEHEWKDFEDVKPLIRAYYHACQIKNWDGALAAISRAYDYLRIWGYFEILVELYTQLIPIDWQTGEQLVSSTNEHSSILCRLGQIYQSVGQAQTAAEYYQQSLLIARKAEDQSLEAYILCFAGLCYESLADYQSALSYLYESLKIAEETINNEIKFKALEYLGITYFSLGDYCSALEMHQRSLIIADQVANQESQAIALGNIGGIYEIMEEYELAKKYAQKRLNIANKIKSKTYEGYALASLARIANSIEDYQTAIEFASKFLTIACDIRARQQEGEAMKLLGNAYTGLGDYKKAIHFHTRRLDFARQMGAQHSEGDALYSLGVVYRMMEQLDKAIHHLQNSQDIFHKINSRADEARVLVELAEVSFRVSTVSLENVQHQLNQSEQICIELKLSLLGKVQELKKRIEQV